jgi:cell division protein ZapE
MADNPLSRYQRLIDQCEISPDFMQRAVVLQLQRLFERVSAPDFFVEATEKRSLLSGLFSHRKAAVLPKMRPFGMYIWGDVGRGKSMVMDVFFHSLPTQKKKRLHFLQFMLDVHGRVHRYRQSGAQGDPILAVAADIASECQILCFDEMQVHDITDAMILSRLFTALFNAGMVVVFTSNRPPEALYLDGLQRVKFLPFIDLLRERLDVVELASEKDYRVGRVAAMQQTYITPLGSEARAALDAAMASVTQHGACVPLDIPVQGRVLHVPQSCGRVARMSFADLCAKPLGALDYMALTALFDTFVISDIPQLTPENRNEAKRFVTLIDVLYEAHATLICTAAAPPEDLYVSGDGSFEFERTVSRLKQMQSQDWLSAT